MGQLTPRRNEDPDGAEDSGQLFVDGPDGDRLVLRLPDIAPPRAPVEPSPESEVED